MIDRDLMADAPIGLATILDLMDKGVAYDEIELTPDNSQLQRVTVRLVPVSVEHSNQKDTSEDTPAQRTAPPADPEPRPTADQLLARRLLPALPQIPVESSLRPLAPASRLPAPSDEFALPSGVRIRRTAEGAGPQAQDGQQVLVHYAVRSVAEGLVLDDTAARCPPPKRFVLECQACFLVLWRAFAE